MKNIVSYVKSIYLCYYKVPEMMSYICGNEILNKIRGIRLNCQIRLLSVSYIISVMNIIDEYFSIRHRPCTEFFYYCID